ncbi:glycosyltransferase family 4 protein [Dactylosporangium sp. NPDC050688]|uniref:glycosyltransferase family 4 protein n=1 Tax=Dactylosporangium sp. NPDC050688 TaxID=3157217 RepID=UPI0033F2B554
MIVEQPGGRPLRILQISHAYPPTFGGVESHVWDIAHGLAAQGHELLVLTGGSPLPGDDDGPVRVRRHPPIGVQPLLAARRGSKPDELQPQLLADLRGIVGPVVKEFRPDVLHLHNGHHFGPELARVCLDTGVQTIVNGVHDRVGERLCLEVLDWPWDFVVYASHYLLTALPTERPAAVRWLGIDRVAFSPDGPLDERLVALPGPVVFHPARLLRWKGVEDGVRAFARMRPVLGGGTLVLCASEDIADDPAEVAALRMELTELAGQLGVADAVRFMHFDRLRIAEAYRAADLVWYPTIDEEPLGLVPPEAMAAGTPVVVTRSGGMRETVVEEVTGLAVDKGDHVALADAALRVLTDPQLRAKLVAGGRERSALFDIGEYVSWLAEVYEKPPQG